MFCFWSVAVEAPVSKALTYKASEEVSSTIQRGQRVLVPLRGRLVEGLILGPAEIESENFNKNKEKFKEIAEVLSDFFPLPESFIKWLEWVSDYYIYPLGLVASLAFPPLKKANSKKNVSRKALKAPIISLPKELRPEPTLTSEQKKVLEEIETQKDFSVHLLFGVTGSGKTEVYLQLLERVLKEKRKGMVLVPEISLTPQLIERFVSRFGDKVAVIHSQLTNREKTNQWWEMISDLSEGKSILIGARSALFCPIKNLGLIILDEEHEPSFKQDEKLKYNGRDAAIMLGKISHCPVVLGSATPSLESWKNALDGKYFLHRMKKRVEDRALPEIEIVDIRKKTSLKSNSKEALPSWLSPKLYNEMVLTLAKKEQVALFLNRRGVAHMILCPACGYVVKCPNCDISLTLHGKNHLVCHYCDYHQNWTELCLDCKEGEMKAFGLGTEQVEKEIKELFPNHRVARADRDEIQGRLDLEKLIHDMESGDIDILVGTQMIAKGLDFPHLTLVGLLLADVGFNLPDFRATERSFQLITQVSGRAGRHIKIGAPPGKVIIQTLNAEHPSIYFAKDQNFEDFAMKELEDRKQLNYPPYGKLISLKIQGSKLDRVKETVRILEHRCFHLKKHNPNYNEIEVLGPAEASIAKLRNQYRFHLLIKETSSRTARYFCRQVLSNEDWVISGVRITVDVDPIHLI